MEVVLTATNYPETKFEVKITILIKKRRK